MIENNKIKTVDDALDLKFESTENIKKNIRTALLFKVV